MLRSHAISQRLALSDPLSQRNDKKVTCLAAVLGFIVGTSKEARNSKQRQGIFHSFSKADVQKARGSATAPIWLATVKERH